MEGEEATEVPEAITTYTATTRRGAETQDVALFSVYQTDMFNPGAYNLPLYEDLRAVLHATDTGETSGLSMGNGLGQFDTDDQVEAQAEAIPPPEGVKSRKMKRYSQPDLQVIEMHLEDCQMQATSNADTIVFNHSPEYPDEELTQRAGNPTSQSIWDQD